MGTLCFYTSYNPSILEVIKNHGLKINVTFGFIFILLFFSSYIKQCLLLIFFWEWYSYCPIVSIIQYNILKRIILYCTLINYNIDKICIFENIVTNHNKITLTKIFTIEIDSEKYIVLFFLTIYPNIFLLFYIFFIVRTYCSKIISLKWWVGPEHEEWAGFLHIGSMSYPNIPRYSRPIFWPTPGTGRPN